MCFPLRLLLGLHPAVLPARGADTSLLPTEEPSEDGDQGEQAVK